MRTLKELFEQTEPGLSPLLDSIRGQVSSTEADQDDFAEEALGAAGVAGATKKVVDKKKASASSKAKAPAKTKPAKKEEPTSKAKETKKSAEPSGSKKSSYAEKISSGSEWEEGPTKRVKEYVPPEASAKPMTSVVEPTPPVVEPVAPSVNTAPTQAVVNDAVAVAKEMPEPASFTKQAADVIESKSSLPPSKTFGEPIYGDDMVARTPEPVKSVEIPQTGDDVAREIVSSKTNPFSALKNIIPEKTFSLISKNADVLAKSGLGKSILSSLANATLGQSLIVDPTEEMVVADETGKQRLKNRSELAAQFAPQNSINYNPPSSEKTDLNPLMASSKYDTAGSIVADAMRSPEPTSSVMAKASALGSAPRTISAGEPSASFVKKEQRRAELAPAVGQDAAAQIAQEESFLERFKAARKEEQERLRNIDLQEALDRFLSGRAGIKPETDRYEKLRQQTYKDVEKREGAEEEAQLRDPNSPISRQWRDAAKLAGITLKGDENAYILKQTMPFLQKRVEGEENREARLQEFRLRMADIASRKDETQSQKKDSFIQALRKETTSGALGKMFSNYNTAARMGRAISEFSKNPSGYTDYATLMGGLKALQGDESVVRESEIRLGMNASSLANKVKNWTSRLVTGKSLQPEQRNELVNAVKVLSEAARKQYVDAISPIMKQAEGAGINKAMLINEGFLIQEEPSSEQKNPKVEAFAKQHNTDYDKALRFLTDTGQL